MRQRQPALGVRLLRDDWDRHQHGVWGVGLARAPLRTAAHRGREGGRFCCASWLEQRRDPTNNEQPEQAPERTCECPVSVPSGLVRLEPSVLDHGQLGEQIVVVNRGRGRTPVRCGGRARGGRSCRASRKHGRCQAQAGQYGGRRDRGQAERASSVRSRSHGRPLSPGQRANDGQPVRGFKEAPPEFVINQLLVRRQIPRS